MSDALALAVAAATTATAPALSGGIAAGPGASPVLVAPALETYDHAISVALPSLDTGRGILASYERWLPERRLSLAVSAELRESAASDYTGVRIGGGIEARWFWRANAAWLSRLPRGNMVGWFLGAGAFVATDFTHDDADQRWLGSAVQLGLSGQLGYRIAPWRQLVITPSGGIAVHRDEDLSGRLPGWTRGGFTVGLDVGWLF